MAHSPKSTIHFGKVSDTPIGDIWIACSERGLVAIDWEKSEAAFLKYLSRRIKTPLENNPRRLTHTDSQLREYLDGERRRFTIAIDWSMMRSFQREALLAQRQLELRMNDN